MKEGGKEGLYEGRREGRKEGRQAGRKKIGVVGRKEGGYSFNVAWSASNSTSLEGRKQH